MLDGLTLAGRSRPPAWAACHQHGAGGAMALARGHGGGADGAHRLCGDWPAPHLVRSSSARDNERVHRAIQPDGRKLLLAGRHPGVELAPQELPVYALTAALGGTYSLRPAHRRTSHEGTMKSIAISKRNKRQHRVRSILQGIDLATARWGAGRASSGPNGAGKSTLCSRCWRACCRARRCRARCTSWAVRLRRSPR